MSKPIRFRTSCVVSVVVVVVFLLLQLSTAFGVNSNNNDEGSDCFVKWVHGYRLASGRPQKILHSVSLEICKQECSSTPGCAAFAYGTHPPSGSSSNSSICELAINSRLRSQHQQMQQRQNPRDLFFRDGRSLDNNSSASSSTPSPSSDSNSGAPTITLTDLDRNPTYDVYIENPNANEPCYKREPLYDRDYNSGNQLGSGGFAGRPYPEHIHGNGVPIDCFYRLMSGKRLVKTHTLRAISVNSLQECQEACIHERGFSCRSISYRYMPSSGYSYPVSNCELSSYYMQSGTISSSYSKLDFVEDYDYDYFQRESHCKTTSSTTLGVCAVVVRRGGRVSTTLIKSSHHTVTSSQCEHLCATSLFRCRAFAFRHTTRGRDPYVSGSRYPVQSTSLTPTRDLPPPQDHTCLLYDTDLMRLPSYNIEPDPDFDLFEMGRLMGAECVLYEQFLNRRPGYYNPGPVTSTVAYPPENRDYYGGSGGGGSYLDRGQGDQHPHGTGMNYLINREKQQQGHYHGGVMNMHNNNHHHQSSAPPPSTLESGLMIGGSNRHQGHYGSSSSGGSGSKYDDHRRPYVPPPPFIGPEQEQQSRPVERPIERPVDRPLDVQQQQQQGNVHQQGPVMMEYNSSSNGGVMMSHHHQQDPPYYDKGKESCLRLYRQDSYLIPEVSRATFPVKTLDECRMECIRSLQVLRFPCRAMAYRHTSHSSIDRTAGGTCQLADTDPRDPDLVQSRDRYEGAVTFLYDDREPGCARGPSSSSSPPPYNNNYYDDTRGRDRHAGYVDYYNQNRAPYYPPYHSSSSSSSSASSYDRYHSYGGSGRDRDYAYNHPASSRYDTYDRRWSASSSSSAAPPPNYNAHYWDYHNRYGSSSKYYPQATSHHGGVGGAGNYYDEYPSGQGRTTVNGERCLRGCRQNRDAGFYYCQIDEQGAWDFCCRPDHFCGYSKGLSVPWCYVGTGPSQNIWRSCEAKGSRNNPFFTQPTVAYLHDRLPPTVYSLTSTQVANLTKDNAIRLFTNNTIEDVSVSGSSSSNDKLGKLEAKPVGSSQEVIVRVSNSTDNNNNSNNSNNSTNNNNKKEVGKKS